jgi:hypothetical protein
MRRLRGLGVLARAAAAFGLLALAGCGGGGSAMPTVMPPVFELSVGQTVSLQDSHGYTLQFDLAYTATTAPLSLVPGYAAFTAAQLPAPDVPGLTFLDAFPMSIACSCTGTPQLELGLISVTGGAAVTTEYIRLVDLSTSPPTAYDVDYAVVDGVVTFIAPINALLGLTAPVVPGQQFVFAIYD